MSGPAADNYGWVNDLIRTPSGRLVMVGSGNDEGTDNDFVARFTAGGRLDRSFGHASFAGADVPYFRSEAVASLGGERLVDVGGAYERSVVSETGVGKAQFGLRFLNADGSPDASAGPNGVVRTSIPGAEHATALTVVQVAGGRVLAGGQAAVARRSVLAIAAYGPNGALDASFGSAGVILDDVPGATDARVVRLIEAPDRSLLAIGRAIDAATKRPLLVVSRFSANGAVDLTFGGDGPLRRYSVPVAQCGRGCPAKDFGDPTDAVLQPTATGPRIVVSLAADARYRVFDEPRASPLPDYPREIGPLRPQFALLGLDLAGRPDASFGVDGRALVDFNTAARADRVAATADGRLIVAGSADERFALTRLLANGRPDRTFGGQGRVCAAGRGGAPPYAATGLVALPDGSSVFAGWAPIEQGGSALGASPETALIGKFRARFRQSVTCFDLGFASSYRRAKIAVILNAHLRLGLAIERYRGNHTRKLGIVNLGLRKPGLTASYWNGRLHGRRLTRGSYTAQLVQLDRRRRVKRTFATHAFAIPRTSSTDDSGHLS